MIPRKLRKAIQRSKKSVLLLGPRQTGKSTLIRGLHPEMSINLMHESTYLDFASNPNELEERLRESSPKTVFIDEIQRLPSLLNTIQVILDEEKNAPKFYLTGSSARKLKRGRANLLPGRIYDFNLGPLCASEVQYQFDDRILTYGSLPGVFTEKNPGDQKKLLTSYTGIYFKEEIQAEALTKELEGFARFLFVVAAECTRYLDLSKLASQAQVKRHSATRWFEILEDTLLLGRVSSFAKSTRKRLVQHPRYFFFDNGILSALLKNFSASQDRIGPLFENLFYSQLVASAAAKDTPIEVKNYRTEHGAEIDFIVELENEIWAIECKAKKQITKLDSRNFESFASTHRKPFRKAIAYLGTSKKTVKGIPILPWQSLLQEMGL